MAFQEDLNKETKKSYGSEQDVTFVHILIVCGIWYHRTDVDHLHTGGSGWLRCTGGSHSGSGCGGGRSWSSCSGRSGGGSRWFCGGGGC